MPFRVDKQFRAVEFHLKDPTLARKITRLFVKVSPEEYRGLYNMLKAAASLDKDRFSLDDREALIFWGALTDFQKGVKNSQRLFFQQLISAYETGRRANRVFNQVSALKKYWDYSCPIKARFLDQKNTKVYYRIVKENTPDFPVIEGITDKFGWSRIDFFPPEVGEYRVYASTNKDDLSGEVNLDSPALAVGTLSVLPDKPTVVLDIVGLFHHYNFETAVTFLKRIEAAGYQIIGITPHDDLHEQDRLKALLGDSCLTSVSIVHNDFRLSDYFETDRGMQEYLAEYVKQMYGVRGIPVVAAVAFSNVAARGFELSAVFGPRDVLAPTGVSEYGKEPLFLGEDALEQIYKYLSDEKTIEKYSQKIDSDVALRDNVDYKERISWLLNGALASRYTDGNHFSYIRDESKRGDHGNASFEGYCDHIERTGNRGTILFETYAWHSDEEGLTIAMLLADKAYRAKAEWDKIILEKIGALLNNAKEEGSPEIASALQGLIAGIERIDREESKDNPKWGELAVIYRRLIKKLIEKPGDKLLAEEREGIFEEVERRFKDLKAPDADVQQMLVDRLQKLAEERGVDPILKKGIEEVAQFVKTLPRVPVYCLVDKTAFFQFPAPAGIHDGKMALEILKKSGVWLTVVRRDFAYRENGEVVDPLYYRREPFSQVIPCKHTKLAVFELMDEDGKSEWVALGGGRFPGTKMMGPLGYRRRRPPGPLTDALGQSSGNFEDDTYALKGPIVADIYKLILESIDRNRPLQGYGSSFEYIRPLAFPPYDIKAGDNRMWLVHRFPWEGVSPAAAIGHMIWNNSSEAGELTIVNGYNLDDRWLAELKHLIYGGSVGVSEKNRKKVNIYTGGMKFVRDMLDTQKTKQLVQLILWMREARRETLAENGAGVDDQVKVYIIKAREYNEDNGEPVDPLISSNQQVHNRIYLLDGGDKESSYGFTGNQNVDVMSLKDDEDVEILWGPAVEEMKKRVLELKEKSVCINDIPGAVFPREDGSYMTEKEVYQCIFKHLNMNRPGQDDMSPTRQAFLGAFGRTIKTVLGEVGPKFLDQPTAVGADVSYVPVLINRKGLQEYNRFDVNLDIAKYYGMKKYFQLLFGACYLNDRATGINFGVGVDSIVSPARREWDRFSARWLGLDLVGSLLFLGDVSKVAGTLRLAATPVTMSFRREWDRWEFDWSPVQVGLMAHFGDKMGLAAANLLLVTQFSIRKRRISPVRDGDFYQEGGEN